MASDAVIEEAKALRAQLQAEKRHAEALVAKNQELATQLHGSEKLMERLGLAEEQNTQLAQALSESGGAATSTTSKALMEDALLEMEMKLERAKIEAQEAKDGTARAEVALQNEQKLSAQFRSLLTSLKTVRLLTPNAL